MDILNSMPHQWDHRVAESSSMPNQSSGNHGTTTDKMGTLSAQRSTTIADTPSSKKIHRQSSSLTLCGFDTTHSRSRTYRRRTKSYTPCRHSHTALRAPQHLLLTTNSWPLHPSGTSSATTPGPHHPRRTQSHHRSHFQGWGPPRHQEPTQLTLTGRNFQGWLPRQQMDGP